MASNKLAKTYARKLVSTFLSPIDYTRTREIPALLDVSEILDVKNEKLRILDISSPQILGLSLCLFSDLWKVVYINPYQPELEDLRLKSSALCRKNLDIHDGDITNLSTLNVIGQFDYIFSCSVFEHIHPEEGGDIIASQNIKKLLNPGGVFAFSVPCYKEAFNEYKSGSVYAIKADNSRRTFFQRFYDLSSLHHRIIEPTGLGIWKKLYIGERYYFNNNINKRLALLIGSGKRSLFLGRFFKIISSVFMEVSEDFHALEKPYIAIIALKKDA
jgi:SAM-dependent methyltransferase